MFAVADDQEAQELIVAACETNMDGKYIARELYESRIVRGEDGAEALEALQAFSDRLEVVHGYLVKAGRCRCQ